MTGAPVLCHIADGVATVTLNRPDRMNAWTHAMEVAYFDLVDALDDDPDVRAVVLTGAGRGFCPGLDAAAKLGPAMESLYQRPFGDFARYARHGTAEDVAAALEPYATAGCTTFNLIPIAADDGEAIAGCARVRELLRR